MDSLKNVLLARQLDKPPELTALERYTKVYLSYPVGIKDGPRGITLTVLNGKEAYDLRSHQAKIEAFCALTKKLYIRVGAL